MIWYVLEIIFHSGKLFLIIKGIEKVLTVFLLI